MEKSIQIDFVLLNFKPPTVTEAKMDYKVGVQNVSADD
jgi:hypothetical protein